MTSWYIGAFLPDGVTEQGSDLFREDRVCGAGRVVVVAIREKIREKFVSYAVNTVMIEFLLCCLCVKWNGTGGREATETEMEMEAETKTYLCPSYNAPRSTPNSL